MTPDPPHVADLVALHLPDAKRIAREVFGAHRGQLAAWHRDEAQGEAVVALLRAARQYDPNRGPFPAFMLVVVRQHVKKMFARLAAKQSTRPLVVNFTDLDRFDPLTILAGRPEVPDAVPPDLLAGLTPLQVVVLSLRYAEGLTLQEIADRLGTRRQCVHRVERRALTAIRQNLPRHPETKSRPPPD